LFYLFTSLAQIQIFGIVLASAIKNIQHKDHCGEFFLSDSNADTTKLQPNEDRMKQNTANKYPGFSKPPFTSTDSYVNVRKIQSSENNTKTKRANSSSGSSKPPFTYNELIEQALQENGKLTVSGIYHWIS
jgi:hypothetical protein